MSSPNRFDRFNGEEIIFMYIAMDTYAQASYNAFLEKDGEKLTSEHEKHIEMEKQLISEIIEFGRTQGSIPAKKVEH